MRKESVKVLCLVAASLAAVSCQKLDTGICPKPQPTAAKATEPLAFDSARFADAIPKDYGTPIGVTLDPVRPRWVGLWFQKQDGTIVAVFVDMEQGKLSDRVLTIPRQ